MSDKFQDIYRIPSARAEWWDYQNDAAYFITICTGSREHYFGEIVGTTSIVETRLIASLPSIAPKQEMQLSEMGQIARQHWLAIPEHFPFIKLDAFVVMPNHVHGILVIDKNVGIGGRDAIHRVSDENDAINQSDAINRVSTDDHQIGGITGENNPMLSDNLSRVIRWYKGRTTFQCHSIHADFAWQTRFYDHIIRDEESWKKIQEYIISNPARWDKDKYNDAETS
jgi:REP element-mobilizing transposase RayT